MGATVDAGGRVSWQWRPAVADGRGWANGLVSLDGDVVVGGSEASGGDSGRSEDAWVARLAGGETVWHHRFDGAGGDRVEALAPDGEGVVALGRRGFHSQADGVGWLAVLDDAGDLRWERRYRRDSWDWFRDLATAGDGYVLVGTHELADEDRREALVLRVGPDRRPSWERHVPGTYARGYTVLSSDDGGLLVGGGLADENGGANELEVTARTAGFEPLGGPRSVTVGDAELAARNRRLRRQIQITDIIRGIDQSLVRASSREEIESTVCERLTEAEDVAFAWIGSFDAAGAELVPRAWAGGNQAYLDAVSLAGESAEPAVTAARTESATVVGNVVEGLKDEPWRKRALAQEFHSVVAVPLAFDEYSYGVLAVYAEDHDAFGSLEREVFEELGESIANSINAVQTRAALHGGTLLELTLELAGADEFLARVAEEAGVEVEYEGLASYSADETRLFSPTTGTSPDAVESVLDGLVSVADSRLVHEADDRALFEATVTGNVLAARLVSHGGRLRSMRATPETLEAVVDVPPTTDVREFVEMLRERYPTVELVGRRDVQRAAHASQDVMASLFEALTERQREVLRTAYFAGFFEWPRESTGEEVAEMLDVSQPTVNRHLRIAQKRLLAQLFDEE